MRTIAMQRFCTVPALFVITALALFPSCSRQTSYPAPMQQGDNIVIDVASLRPDTPVFFSYAYRAKNINFFLLRINNKVSSFLDACATCYRQKLGYRPEDGHVICRACNTRYSIYKLEKGLGGCYPIRINGVMKASEYLIPAASLERMADKF